jgi:hypothetical protein
MMHVVISIYPSRITVDDLYKQLVGFFGTGLDAVKIPLHLHRDTIVIFLDNAVVMVGISNEPYRHVEVDIVTKLSELHWLVALVMDMLEQAGVNIESEVFTWVGKW